MKIYKYPLEIIDRQIIPTGSVVATPLSVAEQGGVLTMWVELDADTIPLHLVHESYEIDVDIVGTGSPYNNDEDKRFVGTVVMSSGLVWHVFAKGRHAE